MYVRLIERIDAEELARHRRRELPAEHLRAEVARVFDFEGGGRVARLHKGRDRLGGLPACPPADAREEAVLAVHLRRPRRLSLDRQNALPVLPSAFGDQLLDPHAEAADRVSDEEGHLVPARERRGSDRGAKAQAGVLGPFPSAHFGHARGSSQHLGDIGSGEGGGNEAEVGKRGVAAADLRVPGKDAPDPAPRGLLLQGRPRVRDDNEAFPRSGPEGLLDAAVEVVEEDVGLERRAGLRRHHEKRAPEVPRVRWSSG